MRARLSFALGLGIALIVVVTARPADAHPLGNFTINHYDGLQLRPDRILNTAVVDAAEIPTAQLASTVDSDGDGHASDAERAAYGQQRCTALASALQLTVSGARVPFGVDASAFGYRAGVAGLNTARLTCRLSAPADLTAPATVRFVDDFDAARIGWHEITATADGVHVEDSPVPSRSISDELRRYPNDLLSSPLDVRAVTLKVRPGRGAATISGAQDGVAAPGISSRAVGAVTATFNGLVGRPDLTLGVGLLAVGLAFVLGASHALLPGHGKTIMAAYLAGRAGSARDAVLVGATVTATHTAGVLVLGLALTVSASLAGDAVLAWLGVLSGLLVAALGAGLLTSAIRRGGHSHSHGHAHDDRHGHAHGDNGHRHDHTPARVSRRGLVGLGVAGGLVPSPSALVVLLAAIALGRTVFGVLLVLAYGLGMAATLTVAGLILVRVRDRLKARAGAGRRPMAWLSDRWVRAMPFATACLVVVVGLGLASRSVGAVR